jgi:predicted HAD superfamily phosphohydrolase YqeG
LLFPHYWHTICGMPICESYRSAGEIDYRALKNRGIKVPVLDLEGTYIPYKGNDFIDEVREGLEAQRFGEIFPRIAIASNSPNNEHVQGVAELFREELGLEEVFALARGDGSVYRGKPHPQMGLEIARHFDVTPREMGVIGDRWFTDGKFAMNLGAGALALCEKAGEGDARWVSTLRVVEAGIIRVRHLRGRMLPGRPYYATQHC